MVRFNGTVPGAARLHLTDGVALLRPEEQVFSAILGGFANQQLARNLARSTVEGRENTVKAFTTYVNAFPWQWTPAMVDEWLGDLRSLRDLKRSTIRSYSEAIRSFCRFATDPLYEWTATCEERFGAHPIQIVHEWNTAVHVQDNESDAKKRAFTKAELHAFFAHCDDEVARIRAFGRKGWLPAFRDATLFKTAYAFGTRRNETRMLDAADFGRNPHGAEYGEFGLCRVRFGKAKKGSPPKRRTVLTVWDWAPDILDEWFTEVRPLFGSEGNPAAWPSERGLRIGCQRLNSRFITYRQALGLDEGLDFHSFRRSYVTHLIEGGRDPRFVQEQVGHDHASTTAIYTCVSSDFRSGKTVALKGAVASLDPARFTVIYQPNPEVGMRGLYGRIVTSLGGTPKFHLAALATQASAALAAEVDERGRTPAVVIDESHLLDHHELDAIRMLTNYDMDSTTPFAVLLIGQPTLRKRMKHGVLAALDQRISVSYQMPTMSKEETASYIKHHLTIAGRQDTLFSDDAVELIHLTSRGLPRSVNNIAWQSLIAAFTEEKGIVDEPSTRTAITETHATE